MPTTPLEWLVAVPVCLVAALIFAAMIVCLPPIGLTYYAARGYVRLIEHLGMGD